MESIETITAQEKEVTIKDPRTGKNQIVVVKVWNETVANLTLMALGSSAPEIMLSVIEIWAKGFKVRMFDLLIFMRMLLTKVCHCFTE